MMTLRALVRRLSALLLLLLAGGLLVPPPAAATPDEGRRADTVPGVVMVLFREGATPADGVAKTGRAAFDDRAAPFGVTRIERAFPFLDVVAAKRRTVPESVRALQRVYRVHYAGPDRPSHVAAVLAEDPGVEWAEPRFLYRVFYRTTPADVEAALRPLITPNDPLFPGMTHLDHLRLPEAWDVVKGELGDVVVAIIDGGTEWRHPDLAANVWNNPGEIPDNGVDDDDNGFVDDVVGWNFTNGTPDPTGVFRTPSNANHGTNVAGVAAAVSDNGEGIAGAGWNAAYMPLGVGGTQIDDTIEFAPEGIAYAAANGADIINASFGGEGRSQALELAIEAAFDLDVLVVAAAGNGGDDGQGDDSDVAPTFPAQFDRVLSVGATFKSGDALAPFSNFGRTVDVFAPGLSIDVTRPNGLYGTSSGTSFSSPLVAGIAALVKTRFPNLSADQLREQIRATAENIDGANPTRSGRTGKGRVNALRAVTEADHSAVRLLDYTVVATGGERAGVIEPGESVTVTAQFINYLSAAPDVLAELVLDDAFITITNGAVNLGPMATADVKTATFTFDIAQDIPRGRLLVFEAKATAGTSANVDLIRIVGNESAFATHSTGAIQMSITDEGNVGWLEFAEESLGVGFQFGGRNVLFEGGLLVGVGPDAVSNCVRGVSLNRNQDEDFIRQPDTEFSIGPGVQTAEQGKVIFSDAGASRPVGVLVVQESYVDTTAVHENFAILRYTLFNMSGATLSNLHVGLFMDWDIALDATDAADFDEQRQFGYLREAEAPSTFAGVHLLSDTAPLAYRAIDNPTEIYRDLAGGFTEIEKWNYLSGGVQTKTLSETDASQLVGTGPFTVEPGGSIRVAFAVVAGSSLADLLASVDAAQVLWDAAVPVEEPAPLPGGFAFEPIYPNPGVPPLTLPFRLNEPSQVTLTVYDVLGRAVHTLLDERRGPGAHAVAWDGRDGSGRPVAGGLYFVRIAAHGTAQTRLQTRGVVVVR